MSQSLQGALALDVSPASIFKFHDHPVRIVMRDGEPWFVATDVCAALELSNPSKSVSVLDDDERSNLKLDRGGQLGIISESGVFTLILRCRDAVKPGTVPHRFRKWVTGEVLPAIRKTGAYGESDPAKMLQQLLRDGRYLMKMDERGHITLRPIPDNAYIIAEDQFATVLGSPGVATKHLPEILFAIAARIAGMPKRHGG